MIRTEALAGFGGDPKVAAKATGALPFDMEGFAAKLGLEVMRRKPWPSHPGGTIFELMKCPFDESHVDGSAALTIADERPGFRCQHNGCHGKGIQDVFRLLNPPAGSAPSELTWPDLLPIERPAPDPIQLSYLPASFGGMAQAVAESTETPFDLAALLSIAIVSACIAGKVGISPEPGYVEPLNIYVCPAMESGNRKTAVLSKLIAPFVAWEKSSRELIEPERKRLMSLRATIQAQIDKLRKKNKGPNQLEDLTNEILELEKQLPEVPILRRLFAEDITPERLASLMQEQGGIMAVFSDEGGIFDMLAGRYSKGVPNLDLWLKAHSGSFLRVDRQDINRPPVILDRPYLAVGISPQPDVLQSLSDKPGFRGRGLLARFLYALPKSTVGSRSLNPKRVPEEVCRRYQACIGALLDFMPETTLQLRFSGDAYKAWKSFQRAVEPEFLDGGRLESLRDWGGKLPGAAARLAGIFHMSLEIEGGGAVDSVVSLQTVEAAIALATCLISHAEAVFALMDGDPALYNARKIVAWIVRIRAPSFTVRQCFRAHQRRFKRVDCLKPVLTLLEQHGYVRRASPDPSSGRPSESYEVSPGVLPAAT